MHGPLKSANICSRHQQNLMVLNDGRFLPADYMTVFCKVKLQFFSNESGGFEESSIKAPIPDCKGQPEKVCLCRDFFP